MIEKIIISGYTATPENPKMEKTALGSSDSVDWEYTEDIIDTIQNLKNKLKMNVKNELDLKMIRKRSNHKK